jgi:uncharacterized iron-regulated membrane protein
MEAVAPEIRENNQKLYRVIWRWHFYAGILFAPFMILLAITGSVYLFKPQVESMLYKPYYTVQPGSISLSLLNNC